MERERRLIDAAVGAARQGDGLRYRQLLAALARGGPEVVPELDAAIGVALTQARERNWTVGDVRRQVGRRLGARHAACLAGAGAGAGADYLAVAIEALGLVLRLPALPRLGPAPTRSRRPEDLRVLGKVRALLAKAESTTFSEEAEALSAKAQELMARHAIDDVMAGAKAAGPGASPSGVRLPVDDPYAGAKSMLLSEVAAANRCCAVWSKGLGFSTIMGFETDLEFVEVLYTSLLVQATSAMVAAGAHVDRRGRSRTRSFRQAFLLAYAVRIGQRLREAEAAGLSEAAEAYGDALLPVLANRSDAVEAATSAAFPTLERRSLSVSNAAGWAAGAAAADLASLSGRTEVPARRP